MLPKFSFHQKEPAAFAASVESACLGAPGPVFAGEVDPTNLDWDVSEVDIRKALGIDRVKVVNDLVAIPTDGSRRSSPLRVKAPGSSA